MVELQIVILAVAGSSPVGHPPSPRLRRAGPAEVGLSGAVISIRSRTLAHAVLKRDGVITTPLFSTTSRALTADFWTQVLCHKSMEPLSDLERLVTGCEIIAALDDLELLDEATQ